MADTLTLDRDTIMRTAALQRPVRVTLPARAAYDFDTFVKVQRDIFDRLGHSMCVSGFDIRWGFEDDFVVNEKLEILVRG
ncbi:hypothetical protein [Actinomarinicola tropica]|uniref:Uncharacterized protein n=1 Tax=Actinomarinicola tropica TaxID=2789776 RepID=A0A5Q2REZ4_9ACTN|nr:hypothetical protein [Actinomarinicola tropica]QGG95428.1 hypothetical protein GH723_10145 [Actinomarinicola tropica]